MPYRFDYGNLQPMNKNLVKWLLFISLCLIWGSSFKLMKDSGDTLNGAQIAGIRIFSAALAFVPFALFHFFKLPIKRIPLVILSAIIGNLIPAILFATAVVHIDGSLAGILNSLTPICVVLIGILFYKDKIESDKLIGVLTGFIGLVLLILAPVFSGNKSISFENEGYILLTVLATLLYGFNVNMVAHKMKDLNPIHVATVSLSFMIIPAGILLWQQGFFAMDFSNPALQGDIFTASTLGILGSAVATVLFYMLLKTSGGLFASLVTYGIPFVALFWGFLSNDKITWVQISCLLLILLGVYLANRNKTAK